MDKNFKVRVTVGFSMFAVALVGLYTFQGIPFKILYGLFALMSIIELFSFLRKRQSFLCALMLIIESVLIITSVIFVSLTDVWHFWYIILGVCGYDIFAYLFGKMIGGKIFKKSRPFPHISKNKTWEGTFLGLFTSILLTYLMMTFGGTLNADYIFLFCGPLALVGDLLESTLKRIFKVKDSNEIIIKNKFFQKVELAVGGTAGHGGFLDRIDSTAFAATILLIISCLL